MNLDRKRLGEEGEARAADYLVRQGLTLLEKNFKTQFAEIDLIAREGDWICFVEVKTRSSLGKGIPAEAVTRSKQQKIILAAQYFLKKKKMANPRFRFDVVDVRFIDNKWQIRHIPHAFQAG